jgi:hypothetical protein
MFTGGNKFCLIGAPISETKSVPLRRQAYAISGGTRQTAPTFTGDALDCCNGTCVWSTWLDIAVFYTNTVMPDLKSGHQPHSTRIIKALYSLMIQDDVNINVLLLWLNFICW